MKSPQKYRFKYHKNTDQNATKMPIAIVSNIKRLIFALLKYCEYEILTQGSR